MLTFFRNLVGVKKDQAVTSAVEAIVRWDPQSATEAELRTMEQHLDELGRQVAQARIAFDRERKEADAIQNLSRQRMAAAEHHHEQTEIFQAHAVGLALSARRRPKPMNRTPANLSSHCRPRAAQRLLRTRSAANT